MGTARVKVKPGAVISVELADGRKVPGLVTHASRPNTYFVVFALSTEIPTDAQEAFELFSRECFYRVVVGPLGFRSGSWRDTGMNISIPDRHKLMPLRRPIPPCEYFMDPNPDYIHDGTPTLDTTARDTMVDAVSGHVYVVQVLERVLSALHNGHETYPYLTDLVRDGELVIAGC